MLKSGLLKCFCEIRKQLLLFLPVQLNVRFKIPINNILKLVNKSNKIQFIFN